MVYKLQITILKCLNQPQAASRDAVECPMRNSFSDDNRSPDSQILRFHWGCLLIKRAVATLHGNIILLNVEKGNKRV